jgi:hypothetical protein
VASADISQLSQKGDLVSLSLWTVYTSKPPPSATTHRGDPGCDTVVAIVGAVELHHPANPGHNNPTPSIRRRQAEIVIKLRAKRFHNDSMGLRYFKMTSFLVFHSRQMVSRKEISHLFAVQGCHGRQLR